MSNVQSTVTRLSIVGFWCFLLKGHFGTLTLKFLLNPITKETMTNLQNTVKRLKIIVFRKYFAADHKFDILELLL